MSSNFTLQQLLLSCMMTGIAVSLLVSSLHSQWGHPAASHTPTLRGGLPAPESAVAVAAAAAAAADAAFAGGAGARAAESGLRSRIQQLSAEVERQKAAALKASSSPNSAPSPLAQQCPACPSCGPASTGAVAPVASGSSRIDAAFDAYIALHKRILAKEPGAPQRFIIGQ